MGRSISFERLERNDSIIILTGSTSPFYRVDRDTLGNTMCFILKKSIWNIIDLK